MIGEMSEGRWNPTRPPVAPPECAPSIAFMQMRKVQRWRQDGTSHWLGPRATASCVDAEGQLLAVMESSP